MKRGEPRVGHLGPLTAQLQRKQGPAWKFLAARLPGECVKTIRSEAKPELKSVRTILAAPMPSWEHGLVGTAVDYRIRYALALRPATQLVAYHGAALLAMSAKGGPFRGIAGGGFFE